MALFSIMLQNFSHSGLATREHIWMLSKVPDLDKFKYVLKDEGKHDLAEEVLSNCILFSEKISTYRTPSIKDSGIQMKIIFARFLILLNI